jgi:hypothetical protein
MRLSIPIVLVCAFIAAPALADMGGSTIYFNYGGKLFQWEPGMGNHNKAEVGFGPNGADNNPGDDQGHLYEWSWDGAALSGYDRGAYVAATDTVSQTLFGNNLNITSIGDLWYSDDVLYGTVRANNTLQNSEARFILGMIDWETATVTALANLDPWSKDAYNADGSPRYVPGEHPTGQQFEAMVNYGSNVGLLRNDGYLFCWDGTSGPSKLLGENIFWTGIDLDGTGLSAPRRLLSFLPSRFREPCCWACSAWVRRV